MMKISIGLSIALLSASASAQTNVAGIGMNSPNYSTAQLSASGWLAPADTPTQKAEKLKRALALQARTRELVQQDGGTLTPAHVAYVRRESCKILGIQRTGTGSLAPRQLCGS